MLLRRTMLALLITLATATATTASAQGLVEYALVLVYNGASTHPVVDEIQLPSALEEDCRIDPEIAVLCDELIALEGRSLSEVMIRLDAWEGRLEQAVEIDASVEAKLASADCAEPAASRSGHKDWIPIATISQPIYRTPALTSSKFAILDEPTASSCVDQIQEELDRSGVPHGGTLVQTYANTRTPESRPSSTPTWTDHNDADPGVAMVYTVVFGDQLNGRRP